MSAVFLFENNLILSTETACYLIKKLAALADFPGNIELIDQPFRSGKRALEKEFQILNPNNFSSLQGLLQFTLQPIALQESEVDAPDRDLAESLKPLPIHEISLDLSPNLQR